MQNETELYCSGKMEFSAQSKPRKGVTQQVDMLLFVCAGQAKLLAENAEILPGDGDLVLLPRGTEFDFWPGGAQVYLLQIKPTLLSPRFGRALCAPQVLHHMQALTAVFEGMEACRASSMREMLRKAYLLQLCGLCMDAMDLQNKEEALTRQVLAYIEQNCCRSLHNEEIGKALHYHPAYLNRVLQNTRGCTLHQYVCLQRVRSAKKMLSVSELSIKQVAVHCGFRGEKPLYAALHRCGGKTCASLRDCL